MHNPHDESKILSSRLSTLRRRFTQWHVDALLVTNPKDIRYLTGFVGDDSWLLVPHRASPIILSDARFEEQIQREAPGVQAVMRKKGLADALADLKPDRFAMQSAYLTLAQHKALVKKFSPRKVKPVNDGLIDQRAVKTSSEVKCIEQALSIQQEAFRGTLKFLRPGRSEVEIAAHLEYQMRLLGADGPSFNTIIAADANASLPHAIPGPRKLARGGFVLIDWGARFRGYCGDMTRVVAMGKFPAKISEIYKVCLDAQLAGIAAIRPGARLKEVDKAARDVIVRAGYGEQFGHGLGHGLGLDIHEQPVLSFRMKKGELQPGQVVTVEPGIYLPGVGGVRIEDDVLVTASGKRVLSDLPKSLESAII